MKPKCRRICDLLARYADGDLSEAECADVQRHLEACGPCRTLAGQECGAREVLRACAGRLRAEPLRTEPLPPGLRARCQALRSSGGRSRSPWLRRLMPLTAAVVLVVTMGSLVAFVTHRSDALLAAQLTADHVKCFGLFGPSDGQTIETAEAQQMLRTRFGLDLIVPPSSDVAGVALVGARRCLYAEGAIPHLMYQAGGQDVSLFVLEGETRSAAEVTMFGHHARIWSLGGNTFVLVSPSADAPMAAAVRYVTQEAR